MALGVRRLDPLWKAARSSRRGAPRFLHEKIRELHGLLCAGQRRPPGEYDARGVGLNKGRLNDEFSGQQRPPGEYDARGVGVNKGRLNDEFSLGVKSYALLIARLLEK